MTTFTDRMGAMLRRLWTGFALVHMSQMMLNVTYALSQTIVFARTLQPEHYAEVILLTAVGFYLQPFDQALGRSAYVSLRSKDPASLPGSAIAINFLKVHAGILVCLSLCIPYLLRSELYAANVFYLLSCLYANFWHYNLQPVLWAAGLERRFALLTIIRRIYFFAALAIMWITGSFLVFGILNIIGLAFSLWLAVRMFSRSGFVQPYSGRITFRNLTAQLSQLGTSLLSTGNELLILNSPYAILAVTFGVGPALVIFDTVMKVVRLTMTGIRTFSEVFLRTINQDLVAGRGSSARKKLLLLMLACMAATASAAIGMLFAGPWIFRVLLGPNDIMPWQATPAAALIILMAGLYQPTMFFLSFLNARKAIYITSATAIVGVGCYWLVMIVGGINEAASLWLYATFFTLITVIATTLLARWRAWSPVAAID